MFESVKKYLESNRDLVGTIVFVAIIDAVLFDGAFRERLKSLIEGHLKKAEEKAKTA